MTARFSTIGSDIVSVAVVPETAKSVVWLSVPSTVTVNAPRITDEKAVGKSRSALNVSTTVAPSAGTAAALSLGSVTVRSC